MVSIITPCYNGGEKIQNLLHSIMQQTYRPIEFIFIDDGSIDSTRDVFFDTLPKLLQNDIDTRYVYQKNKGVGYATDIGLKLFTGDYVTCIDSDDCLTPNSLEVRVKYFEDHSDIGSICCEGHIVSPDNISKSLGLLSDKVSGQKDPFQFENVLGKKPSIFVAGAHMHRTSVFLQAHPDRSIYPSRTGQNYQLLLPVYYITRRAFVDSPLIYYVQYPDSLSKSDVATAQKSYDRNNEVEKIILETLRRIPMDQKERDKYITFVQEKYEQKRLKLRKKLNRK